MIIVYRFTIPFPSFVVVFCLVVQSLASAGEVVGWGRNEEGQIDVPAGNDFIAVSAGWHHSLALKAKTLNLAPVTTIRGGALRPASETGRSWGRRKSVAPAKEPWNPPARGNKSEKWQAQWGGVLYNNRTRPGGVAGQGYLGNVGCGELCGQTEKGPYSRPGTTVISDLVHHPPRPGLPMTVA